MLSVLEENEPGKGEGSEEGWDSSSKLRVREGLTVRATKMMEDLQEVEGPALQKSGGRAA